MTTVESLIKEAYQEFSGGTVKVASEKTLDLDGAKKISESLIKVASLPYNKSAYDAVCGIMKLAASSLSGALDELQKNKERTEELEKISTVRGLIDEMLDNSIISRFDIMEKTAALLKKNKHELSIVKEAMLMSANTGGKNIFVDSSDIEKLASASGGKTGIFDDVI